MSNVVFTKYWLPHIFIGFVTAALFIGAVTRVILPLFMPSAYLHIIGIAQGLWIAAFTVFLTQYFIVFIKPRVDGMPG